MKVDLNPAKATVFSTLPLQVFMIHEIKKPLMQSIGILTSSSSSPLDKVKALLALRKVLVAIGKMPEPTKENTWHPNTHNLIDLRDRFFEHCHLDDFRLTFLRAFWKFLIIIYDFDAPWRRMIDAVIEWAFGMDWKPAYYGAVINKSFSFWREDEGSTT